MVIIRLKKAEKVMEEMEESAALKQMAYEKKKRAAEAVRKKEVKTREQIEKERQEKLFDAAFDGDIPALQASLLHADIHKQDNHENYALGEAAVNGQDAAITLLLQAGADPNCKGAFGRTPLWRAAYNGHNSSILVLLQAGADPRIESQAQTPEELCSGSTKDVFTSWDIATTEVLLKSLNEKRVLRETERREAAEAVSATLEEAAKAAQGLYDCAKKKLLHARTEMESRIYEYDCVYHDPDKGDDMRNIALDLVKTAESKLEEAKVEMEETELAYLDAKGRSLAHSQKELGDEAIGEPIRLTQVAEMVLSDQMSLYKNTEKWPLLIDVSGRSSVFLRYRDTNYLSTMHPHQMQPDSIRRAIVGGLRHGKTVVLDLCDVPMLSHAIGFFEDVEKGLWERVMTKQVKSDYKSLLREADGPEYEAKQFSDSRIEDFTMLVLTSSRVIEDGLVGGFVPFRVEE